MRIKKDMSDGRGFKTYYLNNTGSRWVNMDDFGNKQLVTLETKSGKLITRTVQFYEAFGLFVRPMMQITYKGKRMKVFADTVLED